MKKILSLAAVVSMLWCMCLSSGALHERGELTGVLIHDFGDARLGGGDMLSLSADIEPFGLGNYYYICAEIYVNDAAAVAGGSFTISSSAKHGVRELSVPLANYSLTDGWNTVFIYVPDLRISGYLYDAPGYEGVCDLMNIRRVGMSCETRNGAEVDVRLGRVTASDSDVATPIPRGRYAVTQSAAALTSGTCSGSAVAGGEKQLVRLQPAIEGGSVDISTKKYLYFWLYISDASLDASVGAESFELCSGGSCDINENAIHLNSGERSLFGSFGKPRNGWNEYLVPISYFDTVTNKSGPADEGCDFTNVNYIRVYFRTAKDTGGQQVVYAISPIYAVNKEDLLRPSDTTVADDTTTAPQTAQDTTPGEATTTVGADNTSGGCRGSVTISALLVGMTALIPTLVMQKKRKGHKTTDC